MKSVLTIIGTRPEAIKLAHFLKILEKNDHFESKVCVTRQHQDLLDPFLTQLGIHVDAELSPSFGLHESGAHILKEVGALFPQFLPDLVVVQGDTTTAFMGALAAFYAKIPVAHIEAGLRTGDPYAPWPEEIHRCFIDKLSSYFFVPTKLAKKNLLQEGISPKNIWIVGNTSIDALRMHMPSIKTQEEKRSFVVTIHRRENQGHSIEEICRGLKEVAIGYPDVSILFFVHPNPAVCQPVTRWLSDILNIKLIPSAGHSFFIEQLMNCSFVLTDSGGIQEEAPFLGKPVLIARETTERPEGIQAGTAQLIGTSASSIESACRELLDYPEKLAAMSKIHTPYGDGYAAQRIVAVLEEQLSEVLV
jgi:UDP-N-acetylglucosamine 2-epimerase (non-hydrolysing)